MTRLLGVLSILGHQLGRHTLILMLDAWRGVRWMLRRSLGGSIVMMMGVRFLFKNNLRSEFEEWLRKSVVYTPLNFYVVGNVVRMLRGGKKADGLRCMQLCSAVWLPLSM